MGGVVADLGYIGGCHHLANMAEYLSAFNSLQSSGSDYTIRYDGRIYNI